MRISRQRNERKEMDDGEEKEGEGGINCLTKDGKKEREIVLNASEHIERDMREWNWRTEK